MAITIDPVYGFSGVPAIYENANVQAIAPGGTDVFDAGSINIMWE